MRYAIVIDLVNNNVVHTNGFDFDRTFPQYETEGGVLASPNADIRHTSPYMMLEALNHCFQQLKEGGIDLSTSKAIKIDTMQHCTVYTNNTFINKIASLDSSQPLVNQLDTSFSRQTCPIWEDRSPIEEVIFLEEFFAEQGGISQLTGNRAELRFPAAQIMKWAKKFPAEYEQTTDIFLLSAFITSILIGKKAPVDTGDGWGTNLNQLDINCPCWNPEVVSVVDTWLKKRGLISDFTDKLGHMDHYDAEAGLVNSYFSKKYGLHPNTTVLVGTGDNPATLLGCGGKVVISLGSSYTVNGVVSHIEPSADNEFNIFGYTKGQAMALSVFTNGAKVHNHFLKMYMQSTAAADWESYARQVGELKLNVNEPLMLPYLLDESVPLRKKGIIRDELSDKDGKANIRALHLSQILSLKLHSKHLGQVDELCVVGGGAKNPVLMQWLADAFNAETYSIKNADVAAPLGCAISGAASALGLSYQSGAERFVSKSEAAHFQPIPENVETIQRLTTRYLNLENMEYFED